MEQGACGGGDQGTTSQASNGASEVVERHAGWHLMEAWPWAWPLVMMLEVLQIMSLLSCVLVLYSSHLLSTYGVVHITLGVLHD